MALKNFVRDESGSFFKNKFLTDTKLTNAVTMTMTNLGIFRNSKLHGSRRLLYLILKCGMRFYQKISLIRSY